MEDLMTNKELAVYYYVAERTIRRWIADADIEPEELRINPQGSKTPLYSQSKLDTYVQLMDTESMKADATKLKFMIGHIELEGTIEQREGIRAFIDNLQKQLAITEQALLEEKAYSDGVWKQAHENNKRVLQQQIDDSSKQYECLLRDLWKCRKRLGLDPFTGNIIK
jgi:hypothetical protein